MLEESHPARAIWDFVGGLDLSRFEEEAKAYEAWPPRLLISLWICAYSRDFGDVHHLHSKRGKSQPNVTQRALGKSRVQSPEGGMSQPWA